MNKVIISSVITGVALLSPVVAMGISPAREALLGLAPEEAVLSLADTIESNKTETQQKIDSLTKQVEEANAVIDELNNALAKKSEDISAVKASAEEEAKKLADSIEKQAECAKLYQENRICSNVSYKTKKAFEESLISMEKSKKYNGFDDEMKDEMTNTFKMCQAIIEKCD